MIQIHIREERGEVDRERELLSDRQEFGFAGAAAAAQPESNRVQPIYLRAATNHPDVYLSGVTSKYAYSFMYRPRKY